MDKLPTQEQLKELVSITAEKLGIGTPAIIEKDYYVTHASTPFPASKMNTFD